MELEAILKSLSNREYEVNLLVAKGMIVKQIADKLCISKNTVDTHIKNIKRKTGAKNSAEMTTKFILGHNDLVSYRRVRKQLKAVSNTN